MTEEKLHELAEINAALLEALEQSVIALDDAANVLSGTGLPAFATIIDNYVRLGRAAIARAKGVSRG